MLNKLKRFLVRVFLLPLVKKAFSAEMEAKVTMGMRVIRTNGEIEDLGEQYSDEVTVPRHLLSGGSNG